ncbi:hypothetical protein MMC26_000171 [Xylographa opegraphella]|nr:hypothetical protein [Xylographa opegraphella]
MATRYEHLTNRESSAEDLLSSNDPAYLTRATPNANSTDSPPVFRYSVHGALFPPTDHGNDFLSSADRDVDAQKDQSDTTVTPESPYPAVCKFMYKLVYTCILECKEDLWIIEWIALWISLAATIGMFVLLHIYNGYPSSTKFYGLHINSWISGLNTISKAGMIYPIAGAMGQCKWLWFREKRTLDGLGKFDSASQDPKEAVSFLWSHKAMSVASLEALVTIFTLGIDFFVQNAVNLEVLALRVGDATTTRLQTYNATITSGRPMAMSYIAPLLDIQIVWALYAGAFGSPLQSSVSCSTGNCTWNLPYTSLALCSQCQNISHQIQLVNTPGPNDKGVKCRLPNGLELYNNRDFEDPSQNFNGSGVDEFVASTNYWPSVPFGPPHNMINFTALSVNQAYECSIFMCVNQYQLSVTDGIITETVAQTWDSSSLNSTPGFIYQDQPMYSLVIPHDEDDSNTVDNPVFSIGTYTYSVLQHFLSSTFSNEIIQDAPIYSPVLEALAGYGTFKDPNAPDNVDLSNLPEIMANITQSISAALRQTEYMNTTIGNALRPGTYIQVVWYWLIFPGLLLMITLVFLSTTIRQTKKGGMETWKASPLPLLFHGLSPQYLSELERVSQLSLMDQKARKLNVQLMQRNGGWMLELVKESGKTPGQATVT